MAQELSLFDFFEEEVVVPVQEPLQSEEPVVAPAVESEEKVTQVAEESVVEPEQPAEKQIEAIVELPVEKTELPQPPIEKPARSDKKLYYSISEVSAMFGLNASNLRFWEKEFNILKPRTNKKGTRFYTVSDIEIIKLICYLVKQQGLTLEGARRHLKNNLAEVKRNAEIAERLLALKQEIKAMQEEINEE